MKVALFVAFHADVTEKHEIPNAVNFYLFCIFDV